MVLNAFPPMQVTRLHQTNDNVFIPGIPRLYAGLPFALIQGPLSRFGDTASNSLVLSFWAYVDTSDSLPVVAKTLLASVVAGGWRILITPVDSAKTILQVQSTTPNSTPNLLYLLLELAVATSPAIMSRWKAPQVWGYSRSGLKPKVH